MSIKNRGETDHMGDRVPSAVALMNAEHAENRRNQEWRKNMEDRRSVALDVALRLRAGVVGAKVGDLVEDARAIEAYLRGDTNPAAQ